MFLRDLISVLNYHLFGKNYIPSTAYASFDTPVEDPKSDLILYLFRKGKRSVKILDHLCTLIEEVNEVAHESHISLWWELDLFLSKRIRKLLK